MPHLVPMRGLDKQKGSPTVNKRQILKNMTVMIRQIFIRMNIRKQQIFKNMIVGERIKISWNKHI
jgi:hypothetical protein